MIKGGCTQEREDRREWKRGEGDGSLMRWERDASEHGAGEELGFG